VYADADVVWSAKPDTAEIDLQIPMTGIKADKFIRVEAEGEDPLKVMISTPFFIEK
jgi:hypothetical protein